MRGIERGEIKCPYTWWDLNPRPLGYEACALPLCFNHCPMQGQMMRTLCLTRGFNPGGKTVLKEKSENRGAKKVAMCTRCENF